MKRNHKLLSVLLTVGLVACGQPALPALTGSAPAASQPSNLPGAQLSATRQLGFVQLSFSDIMGDLKAGAHVSDGGAFSSQSLTQQPSVGVTLLKKGVTIVGNFRYIWGTYTITNNTTAPVTNLTLLGVNRSTYNGGSSVSSATLVSGDPASDQVVWQTAPSQAVLSDGSIDPARADFVAYNESDITDSIKQYAASRTIPITTVFPFGFVARSGTTPTATASRSIAAGATGTLTVSFRVPASTNLNAFNWNGIILVDSRARVARGVQEGQISADGVSGRADNVPTSEVDVALLGQDTNQANCVTPSKCTTIRIDDVRIAGGPGTNVQTVTLLPHPIFVDPGTLTTNEQELLAVTFSASDTSGTPSVFTAEEPLPAGATLLPSGAFSWTPTGSQAGSYTIKIRATNGNGSYTVLTKQITVVDNTAPVFNTINSPASVNENAAVSFPVSATDADNDTLTYDAVVVTQNGTAALSTIGATFSGGTFNWTPSFTQSGSYTIRFKASDGTTETTKDVTINVTDVNRAPTLNTITTPQAVNEGQALNFTVSGSDADNDTLTYDAVVVTQNGTAALSTIGATLSSSGAFSWTPSFTQSGSYTIRFTSNDGKTSSQAQDVTINVGDANRAPVFNTINSPASVNENAAVSFPVSATDADNDTLTYDAVVVTQNGTAALSTIGATFSGGTFNWTPSFTQSGSYTIRFKASDGTTETTKDVTINVTDVNRAPTLNTITTPQAVNEGQALNFTVSGSDADNDTLTYDAVVVTQNGTAALSTIGATLSSSGAFSWTPSFTQSGSYTIRFTSNDGKTSSQAQDVTINVANVNQAPTLNTITTPQAANEGQALNFTVSGSDPDGTTPTYTATYLIGGVAQANLPTGASFNTTTGAFNWTPSFTQSGSYVIRFRSTDGSLTSQAQDVTINVANVNQAPTLNTITTPQAVNEGQALNFTVSGSDPDGTTVSYTAEYLIGGVAQANLPTGASFNTTTGAFNWTPSFTQSGSYTIRFRSTDGSLTSQAQDVTINVANVNQAPTLNTITTPQAVNEGQALNFTVSGSDPDGTTPTYTATYLIGGVAQANLPTGASFNTTTGAFNWTPSFTQSGSYTIRFRSTDGSLTSQAQDVTINVANVNQAPTLNTITTPQAVNEGQALNFTVSGSDPDGTTPTYTATYLIGGVAQANLPTGASFNTTTGAFNWTPSFTQSGSYVIRFRSTDGSLTSQAQDVTINVTDVAVVAPQWRLYSVGQNMKSESYAGGVVKAGMGASYANLVINHFLNLADCQANANVWDPRSSVILDATGAWSTNINKPAGTTLWARFVDSNNVAVSACSSATLP